MLVDGYDYPTADDAARELFDDFQQWRETPTLRGGGMWTDGYAPAVAAAYFLLGKTADDGEHTAVAEALGEEWDRQAERISDFYHADPVMR